MRKMTKQRISKNIENNPNPIIIRDEKQKVEKTDYDANSNANTSTNKNARKITIY